MTEPSADQLVAARSARVQRVMRQHPLLFFFFIAYAFSWIISTPYVLCVWGILPGGGGNGVASLLFNIKAYAGPTVAASIVTSVTAGKEGLLRLRRRITQWRARWQWYLFIIVGGPALLLFGLIIQPGVLASFRGLTSVILVSYPISFFAVFFSDALAEEIGWRGFALPRIQPRYGPLRGTLLLGIVWGFWHLFYFLTPERGGGPGTSVTTVMTSFFIFLLSVVALAIILTWVFNHTQGSVFIASLLHTSVDTPQVVWIPLFVIVNATILNVAGLVGFGVPAALIVVLTRGRLGYRPLEGNA